MLLIYLLILFQLFIPDPYNSLAERIIVKMDQMYKNNPQEKIFVHFDKPYYVSGENIWFKTYLLDAYDHLPFNLSSIVYIDLIDPKETIIDQRRIKIVEGFGHGDFILQDSMAAGNYTIRAYTNHMLNFDPVYIFRKSIRIIPKYNDTTSTKHTSEINRNSIQIRFFPEGGDLVGGLLSSVAFKCTDNLGKGIDIRGQIVNDKNDTITDFKSRKLGMGSFKMIPESNQKYFASFFYKNKNHLVQLPEVKEYGYVMHVVNLGDKIILKVLNNMNKPMDDSFIIGHIRGRLFTYIPAIRGNKFLNGKLIIEKSGTGVGCFTFFDANGIPQCERLIYIDDGKNKTRAKISSNKEIYSKRDKANFKIHVLNDKEKQIPANLSISITNTETINPIKGQSNILTYLYLESDISEYIVEPGYLFNEDQNERKAILDLIMLTNGWRRFKWEKLLADGYNTLPNKYEDGFSIEGQISDWNRRNPMKAEVNLSVLQQEFIYQEIKTDSKGKFSFTDLDLPDTSSIIIQAVKKRYKYRKKKIKERTLNNLYIQIKPYQFPDIHHNSLKNHQNDLNLVEIEKYTKLYNQILTIDSTFDGQTIILDEVTIKASKIRNEYFDRARMYGFPNTRIIIDSLPTPLIYLSALDLIRMRVPGIQVIGNPPFCKIIIRRTQDYSPSTTIISTGSAESRGGPLILIDGIPNYYADDLYNLPANQIAFIDVLIGAKAAIYGVRGGNGVILVYTRYDRPQQLKDETIGIVNLLYRGYSQAREFYMPDYVLPNEDHIKPDYRTTLFWEPNFITNGDNEEELTFYTSDETGQYRIEVQGISIHGDPIFKEFFFQVE